MTEEIPVTAVEVIVTAPLEPVASVMSVPARR